MALAAAVLLAACTSTSDTTVPDTTVPATQTSVVSADPAKAEAIREIVDRAMVDEDLRAVIVKVTVDGEEVLTEAMGTSMTGVPATTDMHFRNGAVAISYVATLLLRLVDEGTVSLDDKVSTWLPDVPHAEEVTLGQLAAMTSGYQDYEKDDDFIAAIEGDPFRYYTPEELIAIGASKPLWFEPGTNWSYAHTNYVILGRALEAITGKPVAQLMEDEFLGPLGMDNTTDPGTPELLQPALHAYTSERRQTLSIPTGTRFSEDSTYWNPSWSLTQGAIQNTNIHDLDRGTIAVGTGELVSPESYAAMTSTAQRTFGGTVEGCTTCRRGTDTYTYGIGIVISGEWLFQNPLFFGFSAVGAYLPSQRIAISVAATYDEAAYGPDGDNPPNAAQTIFRRIGAVMAPDDAPPQPPAA